MRTSLSPNISLRPRLFLLRCIPRHLPLFFFSFTLFLFFSLQTVVVLVAITVLVVLVVVVVDDKIREITGVKYFMARWTTFISTCRRCSSFLSGRKHRRFVHLFSFSRIYSNLGIFRFLSPVRIVKNYDRQFLMHA